MFDKSAGFSGDTPPNEDDYSDFVVTEAHDQGHDLVGGAKSPAKGLDDDLGIETPSSLMEKEAAKEKQTGHKSPYGAFDEPIGESAPPPPPAGKVSGQKDEAELSANGTAKIKRLSEQEIKDIEKNLYGSRTFLNEKDRGELVNKISGIEDRPFGNTPIEPPKVEHEKRDPQEILKEEAAALSDLPRPKIAKKGKGIAYFYKSYIQLVGSIELHDDDELVVNNREFVLKPKKIRRNYVLGTASAAFLLLLFIVGSFFISDIGSNTGQIVGVVLDESERPYIEGAVIKLPDAGRTAKSNAQGLFLLDQVPIGAQKIEYVANGRLVKVDYATVARNGVSLVVLRPDQASLSSLPLQQNSLPETKTPTRTEAASQSLTAVTTSANSQPVKQEPAASTAKKASSSNTSHASESSEAKISLKANVDNARLVLNDVVMGAGNLTYSKVKPGQYSYSVTRDGYSPEKGMLYVAAGENKELTVNLKPMPSAEKAAAYTGTDFFYSGKAALESGQYETAIEDLTKVLDKQPSNAEACFARGESFSALRRYEAAHDDYVRAAEIYQFKKDYNNSVKAFSFAIKVNEKSVPAYLGRAKAYQNKGELLAAVADYDKVIYLDKRSFQAYYGLGESRFKQQQFTKAIEHFKDARSLDGSNPLVHQYLMLSYMAVNDFKNLKKSYTKFQENASPEEMKRFESDRQYATIMRLIETQ